jgi:hypothetical protein
MEYSPLQATASNILLRQGTMDKPQKQSRA